jgi:hypothetical protein
VTAAAGLAIIAAAALLLAELSPRRGNKPVIEVSPYTASSNATVTQSPKVLSAPSKRSGDDDDYYDYEQ